MDPTLAMRTLAAVTEITTAALSADDPHAVLRGFVRSAAELADADLGLMMVRGEDDRLTVAAAHGSTGPFDRDPVGIVLSARSSA
ncbi:MAG: GAF domain-containing sensor histidine kinase, partial [Sciscionella sp.]